MGKDIFKVSAKTIKSGKCFERMFFCVASHFLLSCFLALFLSLILGVFLFYKYGMGPEEKPLDYELLDFNKKSYENIENVWQEESQRIMQVDSESLVNPFKPIKQTGPEN